jgi:hypothetical protein
MSGPLEIVVILAVVGYLLARRVIGEPAQAKRMLILPVVLSLIGRLPSVTIGTPAP